MPGAVCIDCHGGPEVLQWVQMSIPPPAPGEATIQHHAIGLNFIDVYHRKGLYPTELPTGIGVEGAGVVTAVGEGVTEVKVGDRVAYATGPLGSYSEVRNIPAHRLVCLPDEIDFQTAAAMMLQGMTAAMLLLRVYCVGPGDKVLIHAAAGGVGLMTCQWAKALGAMVIGTVGSAEKMELAKANGCDHVILYRTEDLVQRVREITAGEGVQVVYDGIGQETFDRSLDCLQPRGMMVSYGNASGAVPPFNILQLGQKGSLYLTRPSLMTYVAKREDLEALAASLFDVVLSGKVKVHINQTYPLRDVMQAHTDLEARKTTGSTVLLPAIS